MRLQTRNARLCATGMLMAVGILLPLVTAHGTGLPGNVLLPMHLPVLLCGLLCGPLWGGACGLLLPALNCALTGMPAAYPMLPIMTVELLLYGVVAGLLYHKTPLARKRYGSAVALVCAMLVGRMGYGSMFALLLALDADMKALTVWAAVSTGLPGIVIQLLLIPSLMAALPLSQAAAGKRAALRSAIHLIEQGTAGCVVIRHGAIERTRAGRGIAPALELHDEGALQGAYVVDKVIGRATAMILTHGGARGCYGVTVSRGALEWLESQGVKVTYGTLVDHIVNRAGTGMCPMEQTVLGITDEEVALQALRAKRLELLKQER